MTGRLTRPRATRAASGLGGAVLAAGFGVVALLRGRRPLHPDGVTYSCTVTNPGCGASGVAWLDEAGTTTGTLRVSRAIGLPRPSKDICGMALRIPVLGQGVDTPPHADLLFASTGDTAYGRFILRLCDAAGDGPLTTLLPVRAPAGALLLRLLPEGARGGDDLTPPARMTLSYAVGTGPWSDVADVRVGPRQPRPGDQERHDPITAPLPGTTQYEVVRRLREPAYRAARAVRPRADDARRGRCRARRGRAASRAGRSPTLVGGAAPSRPAWWRARRRKGSA